MKKNIDMDIKTESFGGLLISRDGRKCGSFAMTSINDMKKAGKMAGNLLKALEALENIRDYVKVFQ